jgi:hypothetical protein
MNQLFTVGIGVSSMEMPLKMPKARGNPVTISVFVDANHAGNVMMRQLNTSISLYVKNAAIVWYSKRQNTVKAATFGSEFVALRIFLELIVAMCYKLRMLEFQLIVLQMYFVIIMVW